MRRTMILVPLALTFLLVTACSSDPAAPAADAGTADSAPSPDSSAPAFELPALWGAPVLADSDDAPDVVSVKLVAEKTKWTLDGVEYDMLGYNGKLPGPILQAKVGDEIVVELTNKLDEPTTIHWHGLRISDQMDGNPRIQNPVKPGETFTYRFRAREAGTYWYHPHVNSNQQVERGLYGAIVIHSPDAPRYDRERVLLLDDVLVDDKNGVLPPFLGSHPEIMHGRWGNRLLTNGQASSRVTHTAKQGNVERWRIVNTANARTMELEIKGATFRVIGTDGGPLEKPYTTTRLLVPVGQRYDLEVSFEQAGKVELISVTQSVDANNQLVEVPYAVLSLDVAAGEAPRAVEWPAFTPPIGERQATRTVTVELNGQQVSTGVGIAWTMNGQANAKDPLFTFDEGETVRIKLINKAGPEHPFHLHGQFFRIVSDGNPWTDQPGLKDTVLVPGLSTVEIIAYLDNPGRWMAHCHILAHAELGMMSEMVVKPAQK
ncbi:MAG: multicopper oxidase family protein [Myxococcales bacterium]|nr:multicopper oxidase family protein [Myxococcales bacterium]MCA9691748.1 multicopper oxidase family protein [Myxococcales bacterium]